MKLKTKLNKMFKENKYCADPDVAQELANMLVEYKKENAEDAGKMFVKFDLALTKEIEKRALKKTEMKNELIRMIRNL